MNPLFLMQTHNEPLTSISAYCVPTIPLIPKSPTLQHGLIAFDSSLSISDSNTDDLTSSMPVGSPPINAGSIGPSFIIELSIAPPIEPLIALTHPATATSNIARGSTSDVISRPPRGSVAIAPPHPMQTYAKSGIFKPKALAALLLSPPPDLVHIEPTSVLQALLSPHWK